MIGAAFLWYGLTAAGYPKFAVIVALYYLLFAVINALDN